MRHMRYTEEVVYRFVELGDFEIDESGNVWRLAQRRRGSRWDPNTEIVIRIERRRAENRTSLGYLQVRVMTNLKRHQSLAHRLVWRHFHGPIPPGLTINHRNGVKDDNRPENLELATYAEQTRHSHFVLGNRCPRFEQDGEANAMAKLRAGAVREIRRRRAGGEPLKSIAEDFGVSDRAISKIALGQRWRSIR